MKLNMTMTIQRTLIIFTSLYIFVVTFVTCNLAFAGSYQSSTLGITITYPSEWTVFAHGSRLIPRVSNILDTSTSLEIAKESGTPDGSSLQQLAEQESASDAGQVLQSRQVSLNGQPAYMISYTSEPLNQRVMVLDIFNSATGDYYVFKYKATTNYDKFLSSVGEIINSVKFD